MTSFPFFSIARSTGLSYGAVLGIAGHYEDVPTDSLRRCVGMFPDQIAVAVLLERARREAICQQKPLTPKAYELSRLQELDALVTSKNRNRCGAW